MVEWGYRDYGWEEQAILDWNSVVGVNDYVLHLGDLALCDAVRLGNWVKRLNGRKYLVLGNHDRLHGLVYAELGFTVIPSPVFFNWNHGEPILFTHRPYEQLPKGWWNYHGHCHGGHTHKVNSISDHHIDCGVDVWGFKPRKISDIWNSTHK